MSRGIEKGEAAGLVSVLVINELIWVLEGFYEQKRKDYLTSVLKLIYLKKIKIMEIKKKDLLVILERLGKTGFDFTDLYLAHQSKLLKAGLSTFDKKLNPIGS